MKTTTRDLALFGMLAGVMFASKKLMEGLPNIHLVGVFTVAITVVYRKRALLPLYTYILLEGIFAGFAAWWIPYLYIWPVLWGMSMLLPQNLSVRGRVICYGLTCGLHGLLFGILYAPAQALLYGFRFKTMLLWIAAGFPYDCIHGVSNLVLGLILIEPLTRVMKRLK